MKEAVLQGSNVFFFWQSMHEFSIDYLLVRVENDISFAC